MSKMSNYSVTMWDFEGSDSEVGEEVYEERMAFLEEMIDQDAAKQREEQMEELQNMICKQCNSDNTYISANGYDTVMVCKDCHSEEHTLPLKQMEEEAADKERRRTDKERRRAFAAQFFPEGWEWPKHHSLATEKMEEVIEF